MIFPPYVGLFLYFLKSLQKVLLDVVDMLDSNAQADMILRDPSGKLLIVGHLGMCGCRWSNNQL